MRVTPFEGRGRTLVKILLVRHAESEGNFDPMVYAHRADHAIALTARGREQALTIGDEVRRCLETQLGGRSADHDHVRMWTSPYRRTRETADGILARAGSWISDRREHILLGEQQFGLFDGVSDEDLPHQYPNEWAHYRKLVNQEGKFWARMPLGESRFDVAKRVHQSFGTFHRDALFHGIETLVVVCHGVVLRAFVMMWCHLSPEWFETEQNPSNGAIRLLEEGEDKGYVFEGFSRQRAPQE